MPPATPKRFYGSVERDPLRLIKSMGGILNAVVMQLQYLGSAKVRLTDDIEAETERGLEDAGIGGVRDIYQRLKFKSDSMGFEQGKVVFELASIQFAATRMLPEMQPRAPAA